MNLTTELQNTKHNSSLEPAMESLQFVPGVWLNGKYIWLQDTMEKALYDEALVIKVKQEQIHTKINLSSVFVSNHSHITKHIHILGMHHFLNVGQENLTFVSPIENHIIHHANTQVYIVNGHCNQASMKEFTTVPLWNAYTDRIWSSLKKGNLKYQPMAKGPAASIFKMTTSIEPRQTRKMATWTISGASKNELILLEKALLKKHTSIS
ncbi:hypothetical protein M3226_05325 [Neobacillus cucumis]|uniref:hypothetical protein n=1 Tax=Neobacillus cucumis TaxID=1740721 RepID=UPI0020406253|nr:hypothetical protein [Neobacillus cucumis]MCM3725119.1 hypothetical protein [Neobacillus cucumis]